MPKLTFTVSDENEARLKEKALNKGDMHDKRRNRPITSRKQNNDNGRAIVYVV